MPRGEQAKEVKKLVAQGYDVFLKGHWRVYDCQGRWLANFPTTSADRRWRDKLYTKIHQRERELNPERSMA